MDAARLDALSHALSAVGSRRCALGGVLATALVLAPGAALADRGEGTSITTILTGSAVLPVPGDPDGSGTGSLRLNSGKRKICWALQVSNISPATDAHIQAGTTTEVGPVVVALTPPDAGGQSSGCTSAPRDLI